MRATNSGAPKGRPPSPSAFEKIPVFKGFGPWRPATVRRLFLALGLTLQDLAGAAEDVLPAVANSPAAPKPSTGSTRSSELDAVIVTANPLGGRADELAAPVQILFGPQLDARRSVTIGEMLSGLPGVSASAFGPNASRPIMRGLDGDRLKVLSNGVPVLDASAASPDHAVAAESLLLDRVEVLRGPAALRFGGGAIGGVVNLIDGRIPQTPIDGMTAQADLRQGGRRVSLLEPFGWMLAMGALPGMWMAWRAGPGTSRSRAFPERRSYGHKRLIQIAMCRVDCLTVLPMRRA